MKAVRLQWTKETPDDHVEKQQQMQPKGFQQNQQYAYRDDVCWSAVAVKQLYGGGKSPSKKNDVY